MARWIKSFFACVMLAACSGGGDSATTSGDQACKDLQAKLDECHLVARGTCNTSQPCAVECAAHADCTQLAAPAPSGSALSCIAACSGAGPTDFVCKDGSAFIAKAGVCDGRAQCHDGSDEAGCGTADAGTGGSQGAGGNTAQAGAGGSVAQAGNGGGGAGGAAGAGGSTATSGATCSDLVAHELAACPSDAGALELSSCKRKESLYVPVGCTAVWSAFLSCSVSAPYSCTNGATACDSEALALRDCESKAIAATHCDRLPAQDSTCTTAAPYAFGCLSTVPKSCTVLPPTGGATIACCPAFPPP